VQQDYIYRAIEFGRRARVPLPVTDTIRNHYGDCKDHSFLLRELMIASGIDAKLALVSTNGPLEKRLASLDQFDHIIVAVPPRAAGVSGDAQGKWRFFDGTDKECDLRGGLPHSLVGHEALLLDEKSTPRLIAIGLPTGEMGTLDLKRDVKLSADGDVAITETISSTGIEAGSLRAYFRSIEPAKRSESVRKLFEESGTKISLSESAITGLDDAAQPLVIRATYTIRRRFGATRGQLVGSVPSLWERYWLEPDEVENRISPFHVRLPRELRSSVTLHLPSGYRIADLPETASFADPFQDAQVTVASAGDGSTLKMTVTRTIKAGEHNADAYAKYVQSVEQFLSAVEPYLVLEKTAAAAAK
jgi:hypothetical protein